MHRIDMEWTVYLAGPELFFPDAIARYTALKALCDRYGLRGVSPVDASPDLVPLACGADRRALAAQIQRHNEMLGDRCAAVLANFSPFRGTEPDSGTVWEASRAYAQGKAVAAYTNDPRSLADRVRAAHGAIAVEDETHGWIQRDAVHGLMIEDYGLPVNLMLGIPVCVHGDVEAAVRSLYEMLQAQRQQGRRTAPAERAVA